MKNSLIFFTILLFAIACSQNEVVVQKPNLPTEIVIPVERLIVKLEAKNRKVKSFSAKGVIFIDNDEFSTNFDFDLKFKKNDSLLVSVYGIFGMEIAQFLLAGKTFTYFDAFNNRVYIGNASNNVVKKFFKVDLSPEEIQNILVGTIEYSGILRENPTLYQIIDGKYFVEFASENWLKKYQITEKGLNLEKFNFIQNGKDLFVANFSNFKKVISGLDDFPYSIQIINYSENSEMKIEYSTISVNQEIYSLKIDIPTDAILMK
jgi:hypothetical protein